MPIDNSEIGPGTIIRHPELVNIYGSKIGRDCKIGAFVEIGRSEIGDRCSIQSHVFIPQGMRIGNDVFIGPGVILCNDKHPPSKGLKWAPVWVMDGASIGAGSIIIPGVSIGKGARIAAGAIITKDVGEGELSYGSKKSD